MKMRAPIVFAGFFLILSSPPAHAAKYRIRWMLAHPNFDYFEEASGKFKEAVEAGSHGDIRVDFVTPSNSSNGNAAYSQQDIAAKVERGEVEMGHSFVDAVGRADGRFWAFEAPYVFRDYRHLEGVFEGPLGADMLEGLRAHHMVGLSFTYSGGACGVAADREIRAPADLKGLSVGVYGDPVDEAWLRALGAKPVTVGHKPFSGASGLDAYVVTWRNYKLGRLDRDLRYVSLMNSTYLVSVTYANEKFFDRLPKEYQELVRRASQEAGRIERAKTIELNEISKREMLARGVHPVVLSEKAARRFVDALKPAAQDSIEAAVGKGFLDQLRAVADGPEFPLIPREIAHR